MQVLSKARRSLSARLEQRCDNREDGDGADPGLGVP